MTTSRLIFPGLALLACLCLGSGCASWRHRERSWTPPPFSVRDLTRSGTPVVTGDDGRPVDAYADAMRSRTTTLASSGGSPRPSATPVANALTRSTAPPPDSYLPTKPISVSLAPKPVPIPPMEEPGAQPAPTGGIEAGPLASTTAASEPTAAPSPTANALQPLRETLAAARGAIDRTATYQVRLRRQERVGASLQPEEDVILSIRRQPRAVRLEWPDGPHKGREVIYAASPQGSGMMHVNMPGNAIMPRLTLPPDSPIALQNSRHPIQEAGLEAVLTQVETSLRDHDANPKEMAGKLRYAGVEPAGAERRPCHKVVRTTRTGETWIVWFDTESHLPAVIQGVNAAGELLERYTFRDFKADVPELTASNAFDPDGRWGPSRGLLSRLARSADANANAVR